MLHRLTFAPFPDAAAATWIADLGDALEADGATGLLLANLTVSEALTLPAVAVLPGRVVVLQPGAESSDSTTQAQQTALAAWLGTWPELPVVPAAAIAGFTIESDSANKGTVWPITTLKHLPQRLRELPTTLLLSDTLLQSWAESLSKDEEEETYPTAFWEQKARQLWNWLGAADVPADPPYGTAPAQSAPATDTAAEQQRLEQLRQQLFAELEQQRLQMEAREAAREQSIAQLRQQLAATPSAAAEVAALQARLAAETQEKNALAAAIMASRQEAEARNRELEARMQQLGQQVAQLQTRPAATVSAATVPTVIAPAVMPRVGGSRPATATAQWQLQWPRVALVLVLLAGIGAGSWAVQHYARPPANRKETRSQPREEQPDTDEENLEAAAPTLFDIQPDTLQLEPEPTDSVDETAPEPVEPQPEETMDSVTAPEEGI
ncbi:hypothetical protein [Hymenobacter terrestris]|uniref:CCDC81-like prokaryotic HU domain-containing protein n=1 Tax=Hymenobacter terrestris TaxID=2748310 RepID=A0ABX2Q525_9BACT|nr:hypothetical protein [Hymenobacter terrestris]NVO86076.1 hypothetical protein [Hymenobacter terrestris]